MAKGMKTPMQMRSMVRQSANQLDYKKVIVSRSTPDMSKKLRPSMMVYPRLRNRVAYANR